MTKYTIVEGKETAAAGYAERLEEAMGEDTVVYSASDDLDDEFYEEAAGSDALVVLGEVSGEDEKQLRELAAEIPAVSDSGYEGFQDIDFDELAVERLYDRVKEAPDVANAHSLEETLSGLDSLAIVIHDTPDPDAISSGVALQQLADRYDVDAEVLYAGDVGRQENNVLINKMELDLTQLTVEQDRQGEYTVQHNGGEPFDLEAYDGLALLDTSVENTSILEPYADDDEWDVEIDVVVDHHEGWEEYDHLVDGFIDIREDRGATASIMTDYFHLLDEELDETVATALWHGIMSDTLKLDAGSRQFTQEDTNNLGRLYGKVDFDSIGDIMSPSRTPEAAETLVKAINNRRMEGTMVTSFVGRIEEPEAIAESADYLRDMKGVFTAMVYGIEEGDDDGVFRISARNTDEGLNLKNLLQNAIDDNEEFKGCKARSGGDKFTAGGVISARGFLGAMYDLVKEGEMAELEDAIQKRMDTLLRGKNLS